MALELTTNAQTELEQTNLRPNLVLEIEGVPTLYSGIEILEFVKIGEELTIGEFTIGGSRPIGNQKALLSMKSGATTQIRQTLKQDKGVGNTVTQLRVALVDKDGEISKLITPGNILTDLLNSRAKLWYGLDGTNWRDDYQVIHRGVIDNIESQPGLILLTISSPQQLERTELFTKADTELDGAISAGDTVINVDDTSDFLGPVAGPDGFRDLSLKFYLKIDEELIEYDAKNSGTQFNVATRGALGTTAAAHDDNASVESFYRLEGNAIDLALKLLMSGTDGNYLEDIEVSSFVRLGPLETVANSIYFSGIDIEFLYNVKVGDYITTTSSANPGSNDVTLKQITEVVATETGSYIVADGVTFVEEIDSPATISFRSQYDTLGEGAKLLNDEVDIDQFLDIKTAFLSTYEYDIYIDDTIDELKEFLGKQIFLPAGAYELPRKARVSVGIHQGPLPTLNIKTLDIESIENPSNLRVTRTTNKNFYNTVVTRWQERADEPGEFLRSRIGFSQESRDQIQNVGNKVLEIEAKGFRDLNSALSLAQQAQDRILRKYKFAAETINGVQLNLKSSFDLEIGDIVSLDMASIKATDIKSDGSRSGDVRLFEIQNKDFDVKTGRSSVSLIDTNFSSDTRFSVFSPASYIGKLSTEQDKITIKPSFYTERYGTAEYKKWEPLVGASVRVRNSDFTVIGTSTIQSIAGNTITMSSDLGFLAQEDYLLELDVYDNQPDNIKLVFGFWTDEANNFADGGIPYQWY